MRDTLLAAVKVAKMALLTVAMKAAKRELMAEQMAAPMAE